jgi:hypothetical protein
MHKNHSSGIKHAECANIKTERYDNDVTGYHEKVANEILEKVTSTKLRVSFYTRFIVSYGRVLIHISITIVKLQQYRVQSFGRC